MDSAIMKAKEDIKKFYDDYNFLINDHNSENIQMLNNKLNEQ
jgi:hypothetical protein